MANLAARKIDNRIFALFVGASKSGKTCAAASFPRPHVMDIDMRIDGVHHDAQNFVDDSQIDYKIYPPNQGFKQIEADLEILGNMVKANQSPFKTLVFDSVTHSLRLLLTDSMEEQKGAKVGVMRLPGPADYKVEAEGIYQIFDYMRALPINVIVTAHIIDRYGKADPSKDFSESIVVGEKLSIRDKIGTNLVSMFNEVYRFDKELSTNGEARHYVTFRGDLAATVFKNLPKGRHDITGKNFYEFWRAKVNPSSEVVPIAVVSK